MSHTNALRRWAGRGIAAFLFGGLLCAVPIYAQGNHRPLILFWTHDAAFLPHLTYVTPTVPQDLYEVRDDEETGDSRLAPIALRCLDGKVIATTKSAQQIADYWTAGALEGYNGIAIDEFGGRGRTVNAKMAIALALTEQRCPGLFVAVWQSGPLTRAIVQVYKAYANLVILESYFSGSHDLAQRFQHNLELAKRGGILSKTVFALGINDEDPFEGDAPRPWANSVAQLRAQMEWIRYHAPEMPGIAFFAPNASIAKQRDADRLAWQIFSRRARVGDASSARGLN